MYLILGGLYEDGLDFTLLALQHTRPPNNAAVLGALRAILAEFASYETLYPEAFNAAIELPSACLDSLAQVYGRIPRTAAYTAHLTGVPGEKLALNSTLPPCGAFYSGRILIATEDESIGRAVALRNHGSRNSQTQREGAIFAVSNAVRQGMLRVGGASLVQTGEAEQTVIDVVDRDGAPRRGRRRQQQGAGLATAQSRDIVRAVVGAWCSELPRLVSHRNGLSNVDVPWLLAALWQALRVPSSAFWPAQSVGVTCPRRPTSCYELESTLCELCGAPSDKHHQLFHCRATATLREAHCEALQCVQQHAPHWAHGVFAVEHAEEPFLRLVHSTRRLAISLGASICRRFPYRRVLFPPHSPARLLRSVGCCSGPVSFSDPGPAPCRVEALRGEAKQTSSSLHDRWLQAETGRARHRAGRGR